MTIWDGLARTLRPMAEASLPDLALIEQLVRSDRKPGGKITETWTPLLADVACRCMPATMAQTQSLSADQLTAPNHWAVSFAMGTPVLFGHRLTVTGTDLDGNAWTRVLNVVSVDGPKTYEVLRVALCIDPAPGGR